jgi:hypothetical protein
VRAGLLSQPEVIQRINQQFVSTTITYFDLLELKKKGDAFATKVAPHWSNPVSLMFFTTEGEFITRLNPVHDFTDIHPDTDLRPGQQYNPNPEQNVRRFLAHLDKHFGKKP